MDAVIGFQGSPSLSIKEDKIIKIDNMKNT